MRRLGAILCLMALAVDAGATQIRCLVVERFRPSWSSSTDARIAYISSTYSWSRFYHLAKLLGIDYTSVSGTGTKTLWAQTGTQVWNSGTSAAKTESFGAVVYLDPKIGSTNGTGAARPDSLLRYAYNTNQGGPRVPSLYRWSDFNELNGGGSDASGNFFQTAGGCTTGAATGHQDGGGIGIYDSVHDLRWELTTYISSAIVNQTPAGGLRKLVGQHGNARALNWAGGTQGGCNNCDSLTAEANRAVNDTINLWERPFNTMSGAKSALFLFNDGNGGPPSADSLYNNSPADQFIDWPDPAEGEIALDLIALARLDSICDHQLFDWNNLPLVRAVTVSHLCSRGSRVGHHGIHPSDTTVFYACLDSAAVLGVPMLFGVNCDPDSMRVYLQDLLRAARIPKARFTPELRTGLDSLAAMNGGATNARYRPRDVLGRYRARAAYGDGSCTGADSSVYSGLVRSAALLDSVLSANGFPGRIERFLLAPDDDWSPLRYTGGQDSILWAISKAGFVGIVSDRRTEHANTGVGHPNPLGFDNVQGTRTERIGGNTLKILAHPGYALTGSSSWLEFGCDVVAPFDSSGGALIFKEQNRAWAAFTQDVDHIDTDVWNVGYNNIGTLGEDCLNSQADISYAKLDWRYPAVPRGRAYVLRFSANDFSGQSGSAWPNGFPPRNGYWVIKSMNTAFRSINAFSGRTVMRFGYPSEVKVP